MNRNRVIKIIIISIVLSLLFLVCIYKYATRNYHRYNSPGKDLAVYIKPDGESTYNLADGIPSGYYKLNNEKTTCTSGAFVKSYDKSNGTVTIVTTSSSFCTLYFDEEHIEMDAVLNYSGPALTSKGNYKSTISCGNDARYDAKTNSYSIPVTSLTTCSATTTANSTNQLLTSYVANMATETSGRSDWRVVFEDYNGINAYRYKGANPNNYVWFNDELWRIIGSFDGNSLNLEDNSNYSVRIIRDDYLPEMSYDTGVVGIDDFKHDINWYATQQNNNHSFIGRENFTISGIKPEYQNMNVDYYFCSDYYFSMATTIYDVYNETMELDYWDMYQKVSLLTPADFFFAMYDFSNSNNLCNDYEYTTLQRFRSSGCYNYDWLYTGITELMYNAYIRYDSYYSNGETSNSGRPVMHLKAGVYVVDGTGTYDDPLILGYNS